MSSIVVKPVNSVTLTAKVLKQDPTIINVTQDSPTVISVSKGFIGPTGRAATATAGTTTTGAAGSNASVTNVGTLFDAVFDFVIPRGDKGDAATLAVGTVTKLAPNQNPTVTNSGTSSDAVFDFGLPGAPTLDLGTVTIVNPDQNPSFTDVGVDGNVVLDISIPRAADVSIQPIVTITPDQNPSVADTGTNGDVDLTFSIPRAAVVTVNPVTVVNPDVSPSVADTGTNGDVDLTFSIPRAATLDLGTITVVTPDTNPSVTDVGTGGDVVLDVSLPRAATITLATTNVLNPNQNPTVADTGTGGDAVYTFSLPRAAVLAINPVTVVAPNVDPSLATNNVNGDIDITFSLPRAADLSLGTVSVVNPDQNPSITSSTIAGDVTLDFNLPRSASIAVGNVTTGAPGSSVTITDDGVNGDVELNFSIPRGDKGEQGDAATLDLGTVTVVNPTQNPSVTNVGTINDAIFDFSLPRAADLSLGTVTVLNPDQNPAITDTGTNGDSVFNISLPRSATFTVGTVTTGLPGSPVTITDVGTNGDVELNFSIPQGEKGDTGAALNVIGSLNDPSELPASGNPGDAYIIGGDLYVWNEDLNDWVDTGTIAGPGVPAGGTAGQVIVKDSSTDYDTSWTSTIDVGVVYDNTGTDLLSTLVQTAITELNDKKLDVSALTSSVTFFPTTAASDIVGYGKLVTSTSDSDYNTTAVNVSTGTFTGTGNLVGSLASAPGVLEGNTTPINITTVGQVRRLTGNTNDGAAFYFEVYKRDSGGTETLIGTSDVTSPVSSATYREFFAAAFISDTAFTTTDRVVLKFYANVTDGGGGVEYQFQYGGDTPVRTLFPVPVSVIPHSNDALDIIVDASAFSGILSPSDDDVQTALNTIDSTTTDTIAEGITNLYWKEAPQDGNQYVRQNASWQVITVPPVPVDSVNGQTGIVVLDTDDISEGATNLYWKEAPNDGEQYVRKNNAWSIVSLTASDVGAAPVSHTHDASDITTGTLTVARGGTGATTHTAGNVLIGQGTSAITSLSRSGIDTRTEYPPASHTHTSSDITDFNTAAANAAPVQSVNGNTGAVNLTAADVGAAATSHTHILANITDAGDMAAENKSNIVGDVNFDSGTLFVDASADAVGIGVTSPAARLHVETAASLAETRVRSTSTTDGHNALLRLATPAQTFGGGLFATNAASTGYPSSALNLYSFDAQPLVFGTSNAERMRIDSSGNVAIGTSTTSSGKLTVNGTGNFGSDWGTSGPTLSIIPDATSNGVKLYYSYWSGSQGPLIFQDATTERMRIDSSGRVGIGTTSPIQQLHVHSSSTSYIKTTNDSSGTSDTDGLDIGVVADSTGIVWLRESWPLRFGTANSERMRIDSSGRVGIGTTSPGQKLDVSGTGQASSDFRAPIFYDSNNTGYYVDPASTSSLNGLNFGGTFALTASGATTGNSTGARLSESYGPLWNLSNSATWHHQVINGSMLCGFQASGTNWGSGKVVCNGDMRAPIFYDYNDTGYYVDPNNNSNLYKTFTYIAGRDTNADWAAGFRNTPTSSYNFHGDISTGGPSGTWWFYESMRHSNGTSFWGTQIAWGWEDNANRLMQRNVGANNFSGWVEYLNTSGRTFSGNLTMSGNITASSDIKLKENIENISDAINKVKQIRGVTFTRNDQEDKEKRHTGVIAQEIEEVLPEVIATDSEGIKSVAYGNMVGLLIEAIKEQQEQIQELSNKLEKLL